MILTIAVIIGLIAGILRAAVKKRELYAPPLRHLWLVAAAYFPQAAAFSIQATRERIPEGLIPAIQIGSMLFLMTFALLNIRSAGFWALGLGLMLNLVVIAANGGWMPISPETLQRRSPNASQDSWQIGERLGYGKDRVLKEADTRLPWLSDRFVTPQAFPYHVAFSVGDCFIAFGAFYLLWSIGGHSQPDLHRMPHGGTNGNRVTPK